MNNNTNKIPKIIHQIWIGPVKRPIKLMQEWKDNHPDYEYILWDEDKIKKEFPKLRTQHLYDQYKQSDKCIWCGRCNLLRYEILDKYGGYYLDADMKFVNKFEEEWKEYDLIISLAGIKDRGDRLNNSFIGCIPKHPFMEMLIAGLEKQKILENPSFKFSGPVYITSKFNDYKNTVNCNNYLVLPDYAFHPIFHTGTVATANGKNYAIHKWGTTKQNYNSL